MANPRTFNDIFYYFKYKIGAEFSMQTKLKRYFFL